MATLTSPRTDAQRRRLRRKRLVALLVPIGLAAALGVGVVIASSGGDDRPDAGEVTGYHDALLPLVKEWGRIEVQGMRPAIADLQSGDGVPAEAIAGEARAWQSGLRDLRAKIAALDPPPALTTAERLFDRSILRYIDAAVEFEKAADGPPADRSAGIERGIDAAVDGARLYNEAGMALQKARQQAGLPVSPDFPNHPAGDVVVD